MVLMDAMTPVAAEVQPPPQVNPLQMYAGVLGVKNQQVELQQRQQNLQTGQYVQQQEQANAQNQQEQMAERQQLQQYIQQQQQAGTFDPNKAADWARSTLALIGQDTAQKILKTQSDKVNLADSVRVLQQNYRKDLGGIVSGFVGSNAGPDQVNAALDQYGAKNPDAIGAIHWAENLVDHLKNAPDQATRDHVLATLSSTLTGAPQQESGMIPEGGVNQPAAISKFGLAPKPEGPAFATVPAAGITQGPGGDLFRTNTGGTTAAPVRMLGGGGSTTQGPPTADNDPSRPGQNDPKWRYDAYASSVGAAQQDVRGAQSLDSNYGTNMTVADQIRQLSRDTSSGPGTQKWTNFLGTIGTRLGAKENVADTQTLASFLDLQSARLRDSMGLPATNAGMETSQQMGTSIESQGNAIRAKTDYYQALTELQHRYRQGLDAAGNNGVNPSPTAVNNFKRQFSSVADPVATEIELAVKRGDVTAAQAILSRLSPRQRQVIAAHGRAMEQLLGQQ